MFLFVWQITLLPGLVSAHGDGLAFDEPTGSYIADLDTNVDTLKANQSIRFSFALWNKERTETVEVGSFWIRVTPKNSEQTLFAGLIGKPQFSEPSLSYTFPKAGEYNFYLRFQKSGTKSDEALAEANFALDVGAGEIKWQNWLFVVWLLLGVLIGAVLVFYFYISKTALSKKRWLGLVLIIILFGLAFWFAVQSSKEKDSTSTTSVPKANNLDRISPPPAPKPPN